jgi:hypothetical protein
MSCSVEQEAGGCLPLPLPTVGLRERAEKKPVILDTDFEDVANVSSSGLAFTGAF